jgi:hypothetical protein
LCHDDSLNHYSVSSLSLSSLYHISISPLRCSYPLLCALSTTLRSLHVFRRSVRL